MVVLGVVVPLALYLTLLGLINRRTRPLMVSGPWDFAGLLFGLGGFFVFLGPALIGMIHDRRDRIWAWFGRTSADSATWSEFQTGWGLVYLAYFLIVVGGAGVLLWMRRSQTAIYNIEPQRLAELLTDILMNESVPFSQEGAVVKLGKDQSTQIEVDTSASLYHATLNWSPEVNPHRELIERKLDAVLQRTTTPDNPLSLLFLLAGSGLLLATLFGMAIWVAILLLRG